MHQQTLYCSILQYGMYTDCQKRDAIFSSKNSKHPYKYVPVSMTTYTALRHSYPMILCIGPGCWVRFRDPQVRSLRNNRC